jgi:hypothetical protein
MLHVNPRLKPKGLAFVFNPLDREAASTLVLPLYYTGLNGTAVVRREEGPPAQYPLDGKFQLSLPLKLGARSWTWLVIE